MIPIEDRLQRIEEAQQEIKDILQQLLPPQIQFDLKSLARRVASGDRQALKDYNEQRKTRNSSKA